MTAKQPEHKRPKTAYAPVPPQDFGATGSGADTILGPARDLQSQQEENNTRSTKEKVANQKRLQQAVADAEKAIKAATESLDKASTETEKDQAQAALDAATEVARTAVMARDSLKAAATIP